MQKHKIARITGPIIKKLRREKLLTQRDLASLLNVTRSAVANWENGLRMPDLKQFCEIASYFGVSPAYLVQKETDSTSEKEKEKNANSLDLSNLNELGAGLIKQIHKILSNTDIYTQSLTITRHGRKIDFPTYIIYKDDIHPELLPVDAEIKDIISEADITQNKEEIS